MALSSALAEFPPGDQHRAGLRDSLRSMPPSGHVSLLRVAELWFRKCEGARMLELLIARRAGQRDYRSAVRLVTPRTDSTGIVGKIGKAVPAASAKPRSW